MEPADLIYSSGGKSPSDDLTRYLGYFDILHLNDVDDHLEAEYFSKEILEAFYKLDWKQIPEDQLMMFYTRFSNLQEVIIRFIYGETNEDTFCKIARKQKRFRVEKLKNEISLFIEKKMD